MLKDSVKPRTCEHALQLVRVFETASFLQLGDHACLALIRRGYTVDETFRQFGGVESLEHVLIFDVLEQHHLQFIVSLRTMSANVKKSYHAVQSTLQVALFSHLVVFPQKHVGMFGKQLWRLRGR